ncbi:MAG: hypothetical protein HQ581_12465 [Planctomycetes bacterium]|nr:hypothetical protein [Planctomycetota bacterium]
MASRLSVGLLVLGLVVRGISWVGHPKQPDLLVSVAWSISLSLVLAWCCILVIIAGTAGYGATEGVISKVLVVGMAVGLFYGITAYESSVHGSSKVGTVPARLSGQVDVSKIGSGLFWFTIGIVFAGCVTMAGGWLASFFRGPKAGITGFGTTRYARDQTCVDIVAGLGILAVGWILGIALLRFRTRRALSIGLIAGTTILGILFAF